MKQVILLAFLFLSNVYSLAQSSNLVENLDDEWIVFDDELGNYVPYLSNYHGNVAKKHLLLNTKNWKEFYLEIKTENNSLLFLNNTLFQEIRNGRINIPIRDLPADTTVLLTIFRQPYLSDKLTANVLQYEDVVLELNGFQKDIEMRADNFLSNKNTYTLITILMLGGITFLARSSTPILNRSTLSGYISYFFKRKSPETRINALAFLFFIALYGLGFAYYYTIINALREGSSGIQAYLIFPDSIVGSFLSVFLLTSLFLVVRFIFILFMSLLYDFRKSTSIHIQEFMNIYQIVLVILIILGAILHFSNFSNPSFIYKMSLSFVILANIATVSLVSYRINKAFPFKKVYLFSYLCATEILPTLFLINFLAEN